MLSLFPQANGKLSLVLGDLRSFTWGGHETVPQQPTTVSRGTEFGEQGDILI